MPIAVLFGLVVLAGGSGMTGSAPSAAEHGAVAGVRSVGSPSIGASSDDRPLGPEPAPPPRAETP